MTGEIYLLYQSDAAPPRLEIYSRHGRYLGAITDQATVRDRFDPPALQMDHNQRFCVPKACGACATGRRRRSGSRRKRPWPPARAASAPATGTPPVCGPAARRFAFDRCGDPVALDTPENPGPPLYQRAGTWVSPPLDSKIFRCQWDRRIELDLAPLPRGPGW